MSTVYPYPDSHASYEAPDVDMTEIERIAQYCVNEVCKKWSISGALYREHRDDMRQTAIVTVYEEKIINQAPDLFIFQNTKWAIEDYIWRLILGRGKGHQWNKSRDVYIEYGYDESGEGDAEAPTASVMRKVSQHRAQRGSYHNDRPVEKQLIAKEEADTLPALLDTFEQEVARILAAMAGRQLQPQTILNRARLLREVLDGETSGSLSDRDDLPLHLMSGRISSVRASINSFLEESPLMQGVIRAKGELLIQWHEEVTTAMLNSGERFVVVLPYGAFTISCKRDRSRENNDSIQVQAGRRVNGKPVNRSCSLGKRGEATYENMFAATQKLREKMTVVHALADGG